MEITLDNLLKGSKKKANIIYDYKRKTFKKKFNETPHAYNKHGYIFKNNSQLDALNVALISLYIQLIFLQLDEEKKINRLS